MTRICPNCGFKVQNDLLMVCPECRQSLSDEIARLSPEEENRVIRRLKRTHFRSMLLFAGVLTIITLISLWNIKEGLEESALERIEIVRGRHDFDNEMESRILSKYGQSQM